MTRAIVLALVLLASLLAAAPLAAGKVDLVASGGVDDRDGDGDPDLASVGWSLGKDGVLTVTLDVPERADLGARVLWAQGDPAAPEPSEWYLVVVDGATATASAGHLDGEPKPVNTTRIEGFLVVSVPVPAREAVACAVAAAEAGTTDGPGFTRSDVAPDGLVTLDTVWPTDGACPDQHLDEHSGGLRASKGSPAPPVGLALAALALMVLARRQ